MSFTGNYTTSLLDVIATAGGNQSQGRQLSDISKICTGCYPFHSGLDQPTIRVLEIVTNCIMVNCVCIFGIIGNCINIVVLRQHGFRETTNIILVSLSTSDLMYCCIVPVTRMRCLVMFFSAILATTVHTFSTVLLFMPKFACLASSFTYVSIIAVERFVAVFFPFHVAKIFNRRSMRIIVVCVPAITASSLIPTFFTLTYEWVLDTRLNLTMAVLKYTEFYIAYQPIIDAYAWIGLSNGFCASSLVIVITCCLAIGIKLIRAVVRRQKMTSRATSNDKAVKMLVTVCLVYIIIAIPIVSLYSHFQPEFIFTSSLHEFIDNVGVLLSCFNASVNFVIYVTMSDKFASSYRKLLACSGRPLVN